MNPVEVANELRDSYVSYLLSAFGISDTAARLQQRFRELLTSPGRLIAGPYLEATPGYERSEATLSDITGAGRLLDAQFAQLYASGVSGAPGRSGGFGRTKTSVSQVTKPRLSSDRRLYVHQLAALDRLCRAEDDDSPHTVVSSGTGSGKTECFLLPAIDWAFRHPTRSVHHGALVAGTGLGLRVVLVYPMNALVNDQIRRLKNLVGSRQARHEAAIPVTFARYTSETKDSRNEGLKAEPDAPDNQLLGRDEILAVPPDILITNFAMLEQALLRPKETPFFELQDAFAWRFLILDEAHSYRGAQGIELSRLMQRVRAAVRRGRRKNGLSLREPICVATSATLTDANVPESEARKVTGVFANALFGVPFNAEAAVIFSRRTDPLQQYQADLASGYEERAWSGEAVTRALENVSGSMDESFRTALAPVLGTGNLAAPDKRAFLHDALRHVPRVHWLWKRVQERPARFDELATAWAAEASWSVEEAEVALTNLVAACNAARIGPDEQSLLPCRYHLFASALEGLFVELASDAELEAPDDTWVIPEWGIREIELRRKRSRERSGFELARCGGCGYPFVVVAPADIVGLDAPPVWQRPAAFYSFAAGFDANGHPLSTERIDLRSGLLGNPIPRSLYRVPCNPGG